MVFLRWRPSVTSPPPTYENYNAGEAAFLTAGGLQYVVKKGENSSVPSYQESSGAPVEARSTLGYHVGPITIVFLNLSKMVGTGVYSIASASLSVYLEFASYL